MSQLQAIRQLHQEKPLVFSEADNGVEMIAFPAYQLRCLNRADDKTVWVAVLSNRFGGKKKLLGAVSESPDNVYRVIAYGDIPNPPDCSLEYSWEASIQSLYSYHLERQQAANRVAKIQASDRELMATF